jgi:uncharacterized membrane protein YGL010W
MEHNRRVTTIDRHFSAYAAYHQDSRNEATHAIGIPMIVLAIVMWAANLWLAGPVDLAWVLIAAATAYYVTLSPRLGLAMAAVLAAFYALGVWVLGASPWVALGLFAGGWALQFVGHAFEGKRPAFLTNATHLLIGPLWILERMIHRGSHREAQ